jgi:large subunit ribosomal protein L15
VKLHDLKPAEGSARKRTRVGRGIAAGGGKTAGRGTKGQKSRAGASIPAWFEGGQTPLHIRIPKLRGFRNINRIEYEVVNVGAIAAAVEAGRLVAEGGTKSKPAPITVNADLLRQAGLVRDVRKPLKILGGGDLGVNVFVVADAFTRSAREKIESAGGTVQVIEMPTEPLAALGIEPAEAAPTEAAEPRAPRSRAKAEPAPEPEAEAEPEAVAEPEAAEAAVDEAAAEPPAAETVAIAETEDEAVDQAAAVEVAEADEADADAAQEEVPADRDADA